MVALDGLEVSFGVMMGRRIDAWWDMEMWMDWWLSSLLMDVSPMP